ncbi:hypothetical protein CLU96_1912 [Chryseobacterium sp. 52]|uniref:hypothetical protein n=1 Tax=Chryseobacterium sp. 52 TaxID=2035213 RepID=UPI000C18FB80|nr:hypothetical protein [Chryseobacterium sp. 52]PIF44914.1 hypothetical protein CLU96_1912 [Chryseobacterium sp. 52]
MAVKKDAIRQKAEAYYIENIDATNKEVAELFKVTEKTLGDWVRRYDWEDKRLNFHASPTVIKQKLQQETIHLMGGGLPTFSADSISKLMSALDKCDKQADPIIIHKILKELDLFISQTDPKLAAQCTPFHKMFLQYKIKQEL